MTKNLTQTFIKKLTLAMKEVNSKYENINYGGCGAFAKILNSILVKKGFDVQYVLLSRYKDCIENINENNKRNPAHYNVKNVLDERWDHIILIVDGKLIDCSGVYNSVNEHKEYCEYKLSEPLTKKLFKSFTAEKYAYEWNPKFKRKQIPSIKKELNKLLLN